MATTSTDNPTAKSGPSSVPRAPRIQSIDALRGLVMFTMIFVNDLAGNDRIVPDWMVHFSDRHPEGGSGMTFVDLVFPGFLFLVGMSIPFALGARLARGEAVWRIMVHVVVRTVSLLMVGIMMVNESPDTQAMGWSATAWTALMYLSAIFAFGVIAPPSHTQPAVATARRWRYVSLTLRGTGLITLVWLACAFRGRQGQRILTFSPFSIHHDWYGILGLIAWAYAIGAIAFLLLGTQRTALLGCVALLMCLYTADKHGLFDGWALSHYVGIGDMLGSLPSITVAGVLLATILITGDTATVRSRVRFTLLFSVGFAVAAVLVRGLYGINKNQATPAWCFWSCAITSALWLMFYCATDVRRLPGLGRMWAIAGQNVLLAYLLSEGSESFLGVLHLGDWYDNLGATSLAGACARSASCSVVILALSAGLNRMGFWLRL